MPRTRTGSCIFEKNCPTPTNASAGADITGLDGQTFTSASFTLANAAQCQGGSPRFDVVTSDGPVLPRLQQRHSDVNGDGTATYSFTAADASPSPITGTIQAVDVLIDVEGTAEISNITVNGVTQVPLVGPPTSKDQCKKGGWATFNNPTFKNQGQCVSYVNHHDGHGNDDNNAQGSDKKHK